MPPLGYALAQLHGVYILAQNADGLVIVDAHAAHERISYERLKAAVRQSAVQVQTLLVPLSLAVSEREADQVEQHSELLDRCGFLLDRIAPDRIAVRGIPALLAGVDPGALVRELLPGLGADLVLDDLLDVLDRVLAGSACHAAIRANRRLSRRDEQPAARHGAHGAQRSVQSRPANTGCTVDGRSGSAVRAWPLRPRRFRPMSSSPLVDLPDGTDRHVGKTALAVELARRFPVGLISVDSALVYRGMNIGTGKPEAGAAGRGTAPADRYP